jgi:hypothetical protein
MRQALKQQYAYKTGSRARSSRFRIGQMTICKYSECPLNLHTSIYPLPARIRYRTRENYVGVYKGRNLLECGERPTSGPKEPTWHSAFPLTPAHHKATWSEHSFELCKMVRVRQTKQATKKNPKD